MNWNFFMAELYAKERHRELLEEATRERLLAYSPHPESGLSHRLGRLLVRIGLRLQETASRRSYEDLLGR